MRLASRRGFPQFSARTNARWATRPPDLSKRRWRCFTRQARPRFSSPPGTITSSAERDRGCAALLDLCAKRSTAAARSPPSSGVKGANLSAPRQVTAAGRGQPRGAPTRLPRRKGRGLTVGRAYPRQHGGWFVGGQNSQSGASRVHDAALVVPNREGGIAQSEGPLFTSRMVHCRYPRPVRERSPAAGRDERRPFPHSRHGDAMIPTATKMFLCAGSPSSWAGPSVAAGTTAS